METDSLYRYMEEWGSLQEDSLDDLRALVNQYPYFHTAYMLLLKGLSVYEKSCFERELSGFALQVNDRKKLFLLVEEDEEECLPLLRKPGVKDDSFSLIDNFLKISEEKVSENVMPDVSFSHTAVASSDYLYWSAKQNEEEKDLSLEQETRLKHQDLIDSFIENDRAKKNLFPSSLPEPECESGQEIPSVSLAKSVESTYFTETLARIYIKQKRYDKALQIIKNLSLKYPEKNIYFADQIRFLERLIINVKK